MHGCLNCIPSNFLLSGKVDDVVGVVVVAVDIADVVVVDPLVVGEEVKEGKEVLIGGDTEGSRLVFSSTSTYGNDCRGVQKLKWT